MAGLGVRLKAQKGTWSGTDGPSKLVEALLMVGHHSVTILRKQFGAREVVSDPTTVKGGDPQFWPMGVFDAETQRNRLKCGLVESKSS